MHALRLNCDAFPMSENEQRLFAAAKIKVSALDQIDPKAPLHAHDALLVVSAKVPVELMLKLANCRVIARYGSGTDNIDVEAATRLGILVTNVPDFCLSEMA